MATELVMPKLGLTMTEGTIENLMVKEGDEVSVGDIVAEISSEKLTSEVEANADGTIIKLVAKEGDTVACKAPMAYIGEPGEDVGGDSTPASEESAETLPASAQKKDDPLPTGKPASQVTNTKAEPGGDRIFITPLARKMADERGIDIQEVNGTGGNGRITKLDIERFKSEEKSAAKTEAPQALDTEYGAGLQGMRKTIAERMMRSAQSTASVTNQRKVDITKLIAFRSEMKERTNGTVDKSAFSINTLLTRAVVLALKEMPEINAWYYNSEHIINEEVHIGMATDIGDGLVVPVIRNADYMTVSKLGESIKEVATKARQGTLEGDLYSGSTFSITNLGGSGIEYFTPIINTPEVAILGVGAMQSELAFDEDKNVVEKQMLPLSMTYDHQLIDGAPAAEFMQLVADYLEQPYRLIL
ncbi:dihydrolipoamide acetyltransferase family protein [Salinicoccus roseus]|jgi:pyruvate dehydrogenase E2 component (dihydrolipoamide acetyltransferase)|uniref:dihydrolipoamide acetyltransferase family protein n=1 Tax=Salinicoccus roseus TaxID=45670 RepID=UPI000F4D4859|nr:dihydrolipoamide acetyltransferase family protein [Salinicoccus roseus]RPE51859.1 pyruvate dehydrogenase E2 component (dihydrolipoamide acetyltransferase) [Salinicoccus roseus]GGA75506.1 dihydrolipoamide acetyltransferase component of pyruvate dehydrogenase complex [Salinicoccus roseus]